MENIKQSELKIEQIIDLMDQSIPARHDKDPDLLIEELCSRFERSIQANIGD